MSLTNPVALALFALAVPIIALYLVRIRPRELLVGTDLFWERVSSEQRLRSSWRSLRNLGSLLFQLALLAVLCAAASDPAWSGRTKEPIRVALVIDNSASMNAKDGSPDRLSEGKAAIRRAISALRDGDEAALIVAGAEPVIACPPTGDRRALSQALDAVGPRDSPTTIRQAIELARGLPTGADGPRIEVFTDGCFEGAVETLGAAGVTPRLVGRRTGNVGITAFQARRSLRDPSGYQILVEVGNFSDEAVKCPLEIERDGLVVDVLPIRLEPGGTFRRVLDKASIEGGRLSARLGREDALSGDDRAWSILPTRETVPVALVTAGEDDFANLYLEKVLESQPLARQPVPVLTGKVPAPEPGEIRVYHRLVPDPFPKGPALVVAPSQSCNLFEVNGPVASPVVGTQDRTSPLLAYIRLENLALAEARQVHFLAKARVLASFVQGEPLLAVIERPEGDVVVFMSSLDDPADLPLRTEFPILMGNVLARLDRRQSDLSESARAGGRIGLALSGRDLELRSPDGRTLPGTFLGERLTAGPLDLCGLWRVAPRGNGPTVVEVACNLANPAESDLRPPKGLEGKANSSRASSSGSAIWGLPWFVLTVLACGLAVLEWRLVQRMWLN